MTDERNIVLLATADWATPYKTNKQHMAQTFAKHGYRVLYVESPGLRRPKLTSRRDIKRIFGRIWNAMRIIRKADQGIWVCSAIIIPFAHRNRLVELVNRFSTTFQVQLACTSLRFKTFVLWAYHPLTHGIETWQSTSKTIYHCVDDLSAIPEIDAGYFDETEMRFAAKADHVFVTTKTLQNKLGYYTKNLTLLPNVVDFQHFANGYNIQAPADLPDFSGPFVGFHGSLSDYKINFELLLEVIKRRNDYRFIFIGDEPEGQLNRTLVTIRSLPNVSLLGFKTYSELPAYICRFDAALLPFRLNSYTESMSPMKYFEYVACGIPVASTPIEFTKNSDIRVRVGTDAKSLANALDRALQDRKQSAALAKMRVGTNTWDTRFKTMKAACGI